jgi:hypothetical protein
VPVRVHDDLAHTTAGHHRWKTVPEDRDFKVVRRDFGRPIGRRRAERTGILVWKERSPLPAGGNEDPFPPERMPSPLVNALGQLRSKVARRSLARTVEIDVSPVGLPHNRSR